MDKLICVVGPTASGKTALAEPAKALDGEVVSCDSMQIYRRMDVGTAKPAAEEMDGRAASYDRHVADPAEAFFRWKICRACRRGGAGHPRAAARSAVDRGRNGPVCRQR